MAVIREEEQALTARPLRGLACIDGVETYGVTDPDAPRFSNRGGVIVFQLKGTMSDKVADALCKQGGFGVRWGCHCAHMLVKEILHVGPLLRGFQHVIIGLFPSLNLPGLVRVSFGLENTAEEVDAFLDCMGRIATERPSRRRLADVEHRLDTAARSIADTVFNGAG